MSEDFLLTPDEVCALLAIGRSTLWTMLKRGEIQSITIGKLRRIPRAALDVWLQERLEASAQPQAVTDTVTDTPAPAEIAMTVPWTGHVTDTVTDTLPAAGECHGVTDTVTDTTPAPTAKRKAPARQCAVTGAVSDTVTVTEPTLEPFDTAKYVLGKLCPRGHAWGSTGQSLLRRTNRHCGDCDREKFQERGKVQRQTRRQAKRQATAL